MRASPGLRALGAFEPLLVLALVRVAEAAEGVEHAGRLERGLDIRLEFHRARRSVQLEPHPHRSPGSLPSRSRISLSMSILCGPP